jgi:hypothetical protein
VAKRGTIVYVHGASDRQAQVAGQVAHIEQRLRSAGMDFDVLASRWGEIAGADLGGIDAALPLLDQRSLAPPTPAIPLAELGRLAAAVEPRAAVAGRGLIGPPARRQSDELLDVCRTQVGAPGESIALVDGRRVPIDDACRAAATAVGASPEYVTAKAKLMSEPLLVSATGRAVAATVAQPATAPTDVAQTVEVRIAEAVLGAALAAILVGYLGIDVGPDLKRWATDVLIPHRARLIREAGLGPADIVLYQRRPGPIRDVVKASLAEAIGRGGLVVALGNSLGGIILVDALAESGAPRPDLLVTVGSQAPLLATFGALEPHNRHQPGVPFTPWLNIYDRRDLLGFVAQRVWPDVPAITDVEVDLDLGFPDAHGGAYLGNAQVFAAIREHPALAGGGSDVGGRRFQIAIRSLSPVLRFVLGISAANAALTLDGGVHIDFGRLHVQVALSNIAGWRPAPVVGGATLLGLIGSIGGHHPEFGAGSSGITLDLVRPLAWPLFAAGSVSIALDEAAEVSAWLSERGKLESVSGSAQI